MKKVYNLLGILFLAGNVFGQNVGIGTTAPTTRLEVKKPIKSNVKISSAGYADTTQLIFSNRDAGNAGTDITMSSNQEEGLRFSSSSDLPANTKDTIMQITPQGNVGIRTATPAYPLDVKGPINVTGDIKTNGTSGSAGQVLRNNGNGTMSWSNIDIQSFKNSQYFYYTTSSAIQNFTVPAGVTKVLAKAWGGGNYGEEYYPRLATTTGGGGGYFEVLLTVTPGEVLYCSVGNGGVNSSPVIAKESWVLQGSLTPFPGIGILYSALPGWSGQTNNSTDVRNGKGGGFSIVSSPSTLPIPPNYFFGQYGESGHEGRFNIVPVSSTLNHLYIHGGSGGSAGNTVATGGSGSFEFLTSPNLNRVGSTLVEKIVGKEGMIPGGGGGPNAAGGNGLVIFYW
jgi:hypothetical protein